MPGTAGSRQIYGGCVLQDIGAIGRGSRPGVWLGTLEWDDHAVSLRGSVGAGRCVRIA